MIYFTHLFNRGERLICSKISVGSYIAILISILLVIALIVAFCLIFPVRYYLKARFSGCKISLKKLTELKMYKADIKKIVNIYVFSKQAKYDLTIDEIFTHIEAGGNMESVLKACIVANESQIDLPLKLAQSLDLSGSNVLEVVQSCIVPKQYETNDITAICKDGIEVKIRLKYTLRSNLKRFLGGVDQNTLLSRIEEATISAIGSANFSSQIIENPDLVTESVRNKDLDSGSMYEIVSIDASSVAIGNNVKAKLSAEKAEYDKRIAIAKTEVENQSLILKEQRQKAKNEELKSELIKSQIEVPKAFVQALKNGKLSTMDYLNIENIKSDTRMRNAITEQTQRNNNVEDFDIDL